MFVVERLFKELSLYAHTFGGVVLKCERISLFLSLYALAIRLPSINNERIYNNLPIYALTIKESPTITRASFPFSVHLRSTFE